jgi:hypothetical protein
VRQQRSIPFLLQKVCDTCTACAFLTHAYMRKMDVKPDLSCGVSDESDVQKSLIFLQHGRQSPLDHETYTHSSDERQSNNYKIRSFTRLSPFSQTHLHNPINSQRMGDIPSTHPTGPIPNIQSMPSDHGADTLPTFRGRSFSYGRDIADSIVAESGFSLPGQSSISQRRPQSPCLEILQKRAFHNFIQEQGNLKSKLDSQRGVNKFYISPPGSTIAEPGSPQSISSEPSDIIENLRLEFQNILGEDRGDDGETLEIDSPPSPLVENGSRSPRTNCRYYSASTTGRRNSWMS